MKRKSLFTSLLLIILSMSIAFAVTIVDTLNYWYSDSTDIGRWSSTPTYAINEMTVPSGFADNVITAYNTWNSYGVSSVCNQSASNPPIEIWGGTYTQLKNYYPSLQSNVAGTTSISATFSGAYYSTPSGNKRYVQLNSAHMYLVTYLANYHTYLHEVSHSLGWLGHSNNISDVLYPDNTSTATSLSSRDINHLNQIY